MFFEAAFILNGYVHIRNIDSGLKTLSVSILMKITLFRLNSKFVIENLMSLSYGIGTNTQNNITGMQK